MGFGFGRLERLFSDHYKHFHAVAMSITKNRVMAEDAVHDALVAVAASNTSPHNLRAYVLTVIRNKALLQLKQGTRFVEDIPDQDFIQTDGMPDEEIIFIQQVLRLVDELNQNHQQVLILKLFAGLTFSEIAEVMESPSNTVASWYRRGLAQLQEKLSEH